MYILIESRTGKEHLELKVNEKIKEGFVVLGNPSVVCDTTSTRRDVILYTQAMINLKEYLSHLQAMQNNLMKGF